MPRIVTEPRLEPLEDPIENFAVEFELGGKMMKERRFAQPDGQRDLSHADSAESSGGKA
jgi:hypothetical protein